MHEQNRFYTQWQRYGSPIAKCCVNRCVRWLGKRRPSPCGHVGHISWIPCGLSGAPWGTWDLLFWWAETAVVKMLRFLLKTGTSRFLAKKGIFGYCGVRHTRCPMTRQIIRMASTRCDPHGHMGMAFCCPNQRTQSADAAFGEPPETVTLLAK